MISFALTVARKDLLLTFTRGSGLVQGLLLGLLLLFVFSLSQGVGERMSPQGAGAVFWLGSAFCQVLIFNTLYALEEANGARLGLLLAPAPIQAVWLGKALAGLLLLLVAQMFFLPAAVVFLSQEIGALWPVGLGTLLLVDVGMCALGSLLGALSQGGAARESLLSIVLFPLLVPLLLAGIGVAAQVFGAPAPDGPASWIGLAAACGGFFLGAGLRLFGCIFWGAEGCNAPAAGVAGRCGPGRVPVADLFLCPCGSPAGPDAEGLLYPSAAGLVGAHQLSGGLRGVHRLPDPAFPGR